MTGFAQTTGTHGTTCWTWDIKTVNAKGLDIRLRTPPGFDALEIEARKSIGGRLARGSCQASMSVSRENAAMQPRVNLDVLGQLIRTLSGVPLPGSIGTFSLDGLLAVRGVIEANDETSKVEAGESLRAACFAGLDEALDVLVAMRIAEGRSLRPILEDRLTTIASLVRRADIAPARQPEAVREKLAKSIALLAERHAFEPDRLHQEALILAAKADVREELDRLAAHVAAARDLITTGGPCGRRLDFLAQELGREASTYCAKVNDVALTAIGLELRVEIEQFREQVQNIE